MEHAYTFDKMGYCENPSVEFSFSGKYIAARITMATVCSGTQAGHVFGSYFRGVRSYIGQSCKNTDMLIPVAEKNHAIAMLLREGIKFFEGIKAEEICAIQAGKWKDREAESIYNKENSRYSGKTIGLSTVEYFLNKSSSKQPKYLQ
jgi:hypothetical protein